MTAYLPPLDNMKVVNVHSVGKFLKGRFNLAGLETSSLETGFLIANISYTTLICMSWASSHTYTAIRAQGELIVNY